MNRNGPDVFHFHFLFLQVCGLTLSCSWLMFGWL
uniref:Uncharacterized protein n=1 Tax=Anguilla anguilla TaxID=7936 RepID=A0A0E9RS65_ANGAN